MTSITDLMRLLQFGDSMLPVGAFAFSNGLEAAIQQRVIDDIDLAGIETRFQFRQRDIQFEAGSLPIGNIDLITFDERRFVDLCRTAVKRNVSENTDGGFFRGVR